MHHTRRLLLTTLIGVGLLGFSTPETAHAINITVNYDYDTQNFFNPATTAGQEARAAIEAGAARYSAIITSSLSAVSLSDDANDARIGFTHPGTGDSWEVSSAISAATDSVAPFVDAQEYRGAWTIDADEWILYAGGRSITSDGLGGTGTGSNFTTVFSDPTSVVNRGFRDMGITDNLPVWGGSVTFDNDGDVDWHFDHTTPSAPGTTDFYSIALHEIGHALGLSTHWTEWQDIAPSNIYIGPNALAAYNADNGTSATILSQESESNPHWKDGAYDSDIFAAGDPNTVGTVGLGNLQDLLMEPIANFTPTLRRFELTNVDVAALEDLGWSVIESVSPIPSASFDGDPDVDADDLTEWLGDYAAGDGSDANGDGDSDGADFLEWQRQFGTGVEGIASTYAVPEPSTILLLGLATLSSILTRRVKQFA